MLLAIAFFFFSKQGFSQGRVLINEYLSWPANSCAVGSEYIELFNFGPGPLNIGGYILTDGDYSITFPPNTIIQPAEYFVIAGQSTLPLGCANANRSVAVNLNWSTCNCTSAPIPTSGEGFMTDGGSGSEQLVLFNRSLKVVDAIVRDLSETASPITTSTVGGQFNAHTFDLDTMNIVYEQVGESQGRANSFARNIDGGCRWSKDPQQSGGASNSAPGALSQLDVTLSVTATATCANTGAVTVSVNSGDYSQIFPMKYTLAKDVDSNAAYSFADSYIDGTDSSSYTVPLSSLLPGIYRMVVETRNGCDLRTFNFNILGCNSVLLDVVFTSFDLSQKDDHSVRLVWNVGERHKIKSFIIQRSTDGIIYTNYANVSNIVDPVYDPTFFFDDHQPANNLYYRILALTNDGGTEYSAVKNILTRGELIQPSVYPNPFSENFTVAIEGTSTELVNLSLSDRFGRIIRSEIVTIHPGLNKISINAGSLRQGVYLIKYKNLSSGVSSTTRIVKVSN